MMSKANELLQELSARIIASNQGKSRITATEAYALVEKIHDEIKDIMPTERTLQSAEEYVSGKRTEIDYER